MEKSGEDTGGKEAAEGGDARAACLAINARGEERRGEEAAVHGGDEASWRRGDISSRTRTNWLSINFSCK